MLPTLNIRRPRSGSRITETSASKRDFFVSFTGADRPWARWLARVLGEEGYSFWFQDQDFHGSIPRSIGEAHANSNRTIVILSEAYINSGYGRSEWEMRYQEDPGSAKDTKDLLILFRISPCTPDPILARISYVDLFACDEANACELVRHRLRQAVDSGDEIKIPLGEAAFPGRAAVDAPFPIPPHNLPPSNPDFVGRKNVLAAIREALTKGAPGAIARAYAITGLGGVGKTQSAMAYCYHHLADYRLIWWLRAEPATLAADFMALAGPLGLSEERDQAKAVQAVKAKLQATPGWLLVLDNAEDPATVRPYLPGTGGGHALLTSRRGADWQGTAAQDTLDVMSEPEALQLLAGRPDPDALPTAELAEAKALTKDLGSLPLALAQARAYMAETGESFGGYRALLRTRGVELLGEGRASPNYPEPVARTWDISLRAVEQQCPAARPFLELLAFFTPDALPREVLDAGPEALPEGLRDKVARNRAIGALNRFSLIRAEAAR